MQKINLTAANPTEQRILDYLQKNASAVLAEKINTGKKTLTGALNHAKQEAQKLAKGQSCICIDDDTVFGWIIHFFEEDEVIELLSKCGLGKFSTKISIVRKLKADKAFRQYFMQNADDIRRKGIGADVLMKAFFQGVSFSDALQEITCRRSFRDMGLPRTISATRAVTYISAVDIRRNEYTNYLGECRKAGLNLSDTKVCFPKNFHERHRAVQDLADIIRRKENAAAIEKINQQLSAVVEKWSGLEQKSGPYKIIIPRTEQDFRAEGRAMANCLEQYAAKVARGEVVVVFIRKKSAPETAYVAAAYDPARKLIVQCYGLKNTKPPARVYAFTERVFNANPSGKDKL